MPSPSTSTTRSPNGPSCSVTTCGLCPSTDESNGLHVSVSTSDPQADTSSQQPQNLASSPVRHHMRTRSRNGISKTKSFPDFTPTGLLAALLATNEPKGFKSTLKHPGWVVAMDDELQALHKNHTWDVVPRPSGVNIVGSKWIYRTKYLSNGSVERLKARLVAQGFSQMPSFDYTHTFSPVVKVATVHIILAFAVQRNWPLHQLVVKNALLNGYLDQPVYMERPPSYVDPKFPSHVCLRKALYGLKQAPRAWFTRFSAFFVQLGFVCSQVDTSLFVLTRGATLMYVLVYVDDIIVTGNNQALLQHFIQRTNEEFSIKDLGRLN